MPKSRFQTFVATRYLVADPLPHVSRLALGFVGFFVIAAIALAAVVQFGLTPPQATTIFDPGSPHYASWVAARNGAIGIAVFIFYVFAVRCLFTFYSTVSIVGLSIGGAALVVVLSVMNGFESDLRAKILGSNAHVQISKDEGVFTEVAEVRAHLARIPGVVASTAFATSEVVIAANSNYSNVVVKGIDVESAVEVADLAKNIVDPEGRPDPEALKRLEPLVRDGAEAPTVVPPPASETGAVVDPAPDDLPGGGDPIDYSATGDGEPGAVVDPAPGDFAGGQPADEITPDDYSAGDPALDESGGGAGAARRRSSRVATLHGVLAGKELFKTIHLYFDQEVRLVSPLADPMNPDANGTPVPFNRDYRVAGMFYTGMYEYDLKLVYVSLESLQTFLRLGDAVDGIEVRIREPDDVDAVVAQIAHALGPTYRVQGWRELNRNLFSALKLEKIAMFLVLAIIILVASFSIVGTLIVTVVEKGKEIALLKTLGASDGGIVFVFVYQGLMIGVIGITLGVAIGLGVSWLLASFGFPLDPNVYYMDRLPIEIDPVMVGLVFSAGIVISVAATIYPAILAAQLRPAHGLKM